MDARALLKRCCQGSRTFCPLLRFLRDVKTSTYVPKVGGDIVAWQHGGDAQLICDALIVDLPGMGGLMYVGVAVLVGQDREVAAGGFAFAADQLLLPFP